VSNQDRRRGDERVTVAPGDRDRLFVRRLQRREEAAFVELVRTYQHRIYALVLRMLGDREEARDVAQEVFVTVFRRIDGFRGDASLSTWLYRVAVNHCKNRIKYLGRRGAGRTRALDDVGEGVLANAPGTSPPPRPDQEASARQVAGLLQRELDTMEEDHRVLLLLRDIEGLSYAEIAEVTGHPIGTVKSRLHRGRLQLKRALERHTR